MIITYNIDGNAARLFEYQLNFEVSLGHINCDPCEIEIPASVTLNLNNVDS
jgi:hypothetical protein